MSGYGAIGGSFVNLDHGTQKSGGINFQMQSIGFLATPPFVMFAVMDIIFATLSGGHPYLCFAVASLAMAYAVLMFFIGRSHVKGPIYTFASVLAFIATVSGIMAGLSIQARFYGNYWNYKNRPVYTDVLATDPAGAHLDGGIINFASNAIVDTLRMGFILDSRGKKFCVAPILDESQQSQAEYWAVGLDCCEGRVNFYCDDAQDMSAKTGAVVFNLDTSLVADPYRKFVQAVEQASARSGLEIPRNANKDPAPILVRWVKDGAKVTDGLFNEGTMHLLAGLLFYGIASILVAFALHAATASRK